MLAGIAYGTAVIYLFERKWDEADKHARISEQLRRVIGEPSRTVRIYSLQGRIALARGDTRRARDLFTHGLLEAKRVGSKDEVIKNHLGLASVLKDGNLRDAYEHQEIAERLLALTQVPYDLEDEKSHFFT
jgi:hypothetical protein